MPGGRARGRGAEAGGAARGRGFRASRARLSLRSRSSWASASLSCACSSVRSLIDISSCCTRQVQKRVCMKEGQGAAS